MNTQSPVSLKSYIYSFIWKYKIYCSLLVFISISAALFEVSLEYKVKEIIDEIALKKEDAELFMLLGFFALYKLMHHLIYFFRRIFDIIYKPKIVEQTATDLYNKTMNHSLHWFDSHLSGEIATKISDFQDKMTTIITQLARVLKFTTSLIVVLIFTSFMHPYPAYIFGIFLVIYIPLMSYLMQKQLRLQGDYVKARQNTMGIINDSISNIFGIKIIGSLLTESKLKLGPSMRNWAFWDKETRKYDAYVVDLVDTILVVTMGIVQIYVLAHLYRQGEIGPGVFAFVSLQTLKMNFQLDMLLETFLFQVNPAIASIKSSYAFVNDPIDVANKQEALNLSKVKGLVEYSDVAFKYGKNNNLVLDGFSLNIKPGERVGIVGTSGAGKTTMMKCLLRYFDVQKGAISIDGHDIREITQESLRESLAVIPQDITMFHRSIKENLLLAKTDATDDELIKACKKAKIHSDIMDMPDGYDTIVGERGVKLSGGQRQRVAIARAILKNAPILILDEATSALDTPTERLIQESIDEMLSQSKATVIAIAHRLSTLKSMDRIIVLDKGKIIEEGTHNSLIRKPKGLYKKLWEMQAI